VLPHPSDWRTVTVCCIEVDGLWGGVLASVAVGGFCLQAEKIRNVIKTEKVRKIRVSMMGEINGGASGRCL